MKRLVIPYLERKMFLLGSLSVVVNIAAFAFFSNLFSAFLKAGFPLSMLLIAMIPFIPAIIYKFLRKKFGYKEGKLTNVCVDITIASTCLVATVAGVDIALIIKSSLAESNFEIAFWIIFSIAFLKNFYLSVWFPSRGQGEKFVILFGALLTTSAILSIAYS